MKTLSKLMSYMGRRKVMLPGALVLSGLSAAVSMMPFIFIWLIIRGYMRGASSQADNMEIFAWLAFGTAAGGIVLYFAALTLSHLSAFRVENMMRRETMKSIMKMPLGFFSAHTSGKMRKIIDDNAGITHSFLAHQLPDLAATLLMPIVTVIMIFFFDWRLGAASMLPIAGAMGVMSFAMRKYGQAFMKSYMDSLEDMNTEAVEYVRGIPVVKVFQQTLFSFKNFHKSIIRYRDMVSEYTNMWEKPMSLYIMLINSFAFFLVPAAILIMTGSGSYAETVLNLILYILITPVFSQCIMRSMYLRQAFGQADEAVKRLENLLDAEALAVPPNPGKIDSKTISFSNVRFAYPGNSENALKGVSLTVPEGQTVALVGPSGSGKTTIARLIPRFWDADSGSISIGSADVRSITHDELMKNISFMFQNSVLFKTSILENIRYGSPDAGTADIERAIASARCGDIIQRLPLGLDTVIGPGGTYLSGGEQQRIILARAFLKDAPIVILDEATAFTDPENEQLIMEAFEELSRGKTVLMIAHRLTSVIHADCIIVIENGMIAEQGTHEELLRSGGLYSSMWDQYRQAVQWTIGREAENAEYV